VETESLYRPRVPLPLKKLCQAAIADLFHFLALSKRDSKDLVARQRLQVAAWMSLWPLKFERHSYVLIKGIPYVTIIFHKVR